MLTLTSLDDDTLLFIAGFVGAADLQDLASVTASFSGWQRVCSTAQHKLWEHVATTRFPQLSAILSVGARLGRPLSFRSLFFDHRRAMESSVDEHAARRASGPLTFVFLALAVLVTPIAARD